jgi:cytidylate kinase
MSDRSHGAPAAQRAPSSAAAAVGLGTPVPFRGVVALDGPSGTGKSTVARRLARQLGARYLDTGAMYRAATLAVLRAGVALDDAAAVLAIVRRAVIEISTDPDNPYVLLDQERVDAEIRSASVTDAVSAVSAVAEVRVVLVAAQRELIGAGGIVVEGRDIATVVWPAARPKVYLTATAATRAQRRRQELGRGSQLRAVAADIDRRDRADSSRTASPLSRAADAVELDTTHLDIDNVVNRLVDLVGLASHG